MEHVPVLAATRSARRSARLLGLASEDHLVALVRAGEDAAFEAIYDRHHRAILAFCRHMLGTREEAEDAVQHTFLAAYRHLRASEKAIQLRPWLFAIARNRCLSLLRARREHVSLDVAEPATEGLADAVLLREDVRELLADLTRLPDEQRAALLLAELGALDQAGIATVLGCPTPKVKALVFQARSSLAAIRDARATPCAEIREQLANASGAALRRGPLRRHLHDCAGCREFRAEVGRQRELLALALPVLPSLALKAAVLPGGAAGGAFAAGGVAGGAGAGAGGAATLGTGAAGAALGGGSGGPLAVLASSGAAKVAVSLAVTGALAGGGAVAVDAVRGHGAHAGHQAAPATRALPASSGLPAAGTPAAGVPTPAGRPPVAGSAPWRSSRAPGPHPRRRAGGNGAAARALAHGRQAPATTQAHAPAAKHAAPPARGHADHSPPARPAPHGHRPAGKHGPPRQPGHGAGGAHGSAPPKKGPHPQPPSDPPKQPPAATQPPAHPAPSQHGQGNGQGNGQGHS